MSDGNTVLLEHFDSSTSGTPTGPGVGYRSGIYGQGISLSIGSWVSWNMGGLAQGTVEFWGLMDTLDYGGINPNFIQASYWPFLADTFVTGLVNGVPTTAYHTGFGYRPGNDWVTGAASQPILAGAWNHYATTWGSEGFHFFVNGSLVFSSSDPYAQNGSTGVWAIGGPNYTPHASGAGFTGAIDELRISNIQRYFSAVPDGSVTGLFPATIIGLFLAQGYLARKGSRTRR